LVIQTKIWPCFISFSIDPVPDKRLESCSFDLWLFTGFYSTSRVR